VVIAGEMGEMIGEMDGLEEPAGIQIQEIENQAGCVELKFLG
jgi:hypothetical protein